MAVEAHNLEFPIPHSQESYNLRAIYTPLAACINEYLYRYNDYLRTVVFYNRLDSESNIKSYQRSLIRMWPEQYAYQNSLNMDEYTPPQHGALSFLPSIGSIKNYEAYKLGVDSIDYAPLQKARYWNTILNAIFFLISGRYGWGGHSPDLPPLYKLVPIFSEVEPTTQIVHFILQATKLKNHREPVNYTTFNPYDYRKMFKGAEPFQPLLTVELGSGNLPAVYEGTANLSSIAKEYYPKFTNQNFIYPPIENGHRLQHSTFFNHIWAMLKALSTVSYVHWENLRSKFLVTWSGLNESDDHDTCEGSLYNAASVGLSSAIGLFGIYGEPSEEPDITENPDPGNRPNYENELSTSKYEGIEDRNIVEEGFTYVSAYSDSIGWYGLDFNETLTNGVTDVAYTAQLESKILCYAVESENTDLEDTGADYSFHNGYFKGFVPGDIILISEGDTGDKTSWDTSLPESEIISGPIGSDFRRSPQGYPSDALNTLVDCVGIDTALGDEYEHGDFYTITFLARYYSIVALLPEGCDALKEETE